MSAMYFISRVDVPSGGASSIVLNNIPQDYTDLVIFYSLRHSAGAVDPGNFYFNTDTGANYSMKLALGDGSGYGSFGNSNYIAQYNNWSALFLNPSAATANTFNNVKVHIPNYSSTSVNKIVSIEGANENFATSAFTFFSMGVWNSNSAINAVTITGSTGTIVEHSSATLYGILKGSDGTTTVS